MRLLDRVRRLFKGPAKESVNDFGFGLVPDPGLSNANYFRQWVGIYQLVDRMARARGGNLVEQPLDDRMIYIARGLMRYNPYAQGFINALRGHTLGGNGFQHLPTGPSAKILGRFLDRWKDEVNWWSWEREIYERVHIEGDCVMRFFSTDDSVVLRPIENEWIIAADGSLEWTFGYYNEPGDVHDITALHTLYGDVHEVIDASEWHHVKSKLSMRADKRGRSDFLAVAQLLDDSFKTWRNFLQSESVRQSVIYFAKQAAGVTIGDMDAAIARETDYKPPQGSDRRGGDPIALQYGAAIEYIQDGTEVLAVPAANAQGTMTGVNAGLLAAGRAYHMPLVLMSGDMGANNTLDFGDESPFGMTVQDEQRWYSQHVRDILWRVVEYAADEGILPQAVLYDGTDIEVSAERKPSANSMDNTTRAKTLYDDGVISARERATMEGFDYDEQQAQRTKETQVPMGGATEDTLVTVHRGGKVFQEHRKSGKKKPPPAAQKGGLDTTHIPKSKLAKVKKALNNVMLHVNIALHKLTPTAEKALGILGAIFDEPADLTKFAYNPTTSGGGSAAHVNKGDFVQSSMNDAFGVGLSGHLVASIVSRVLTKAIFAVKNKLKKRKGGDTADSDAGIAELSEFIVGIYKQTFKHLHLRGKLPSAVGIANKLRQMQQEVGEETQLVTVHRDGKVFQEHRKKGASHDDAVGAVKGVKGFADKTEAIKKLIAQHAEHAPDQHGEKMHKVVIGDTEWHFPATAEGHHAAAQSIAQVAVKNASAAPWPKKLLNATAKVTLTNSKSPDDEHWAKEYGIPNFVSVAAGGGGQIVKWNGGGIPFQVFAHEAAHNLAEKEWGTQTPPKDSDYGKAQTKEPPVTEYGATHPAEDFAEAVQQHQLNPKAFAEKFPFKAAALEKLLA